MLCIHFAAVHILKGTQKMSPGYVYNAGHHPDLHLVDWNNVTIEIWMLV